MIYILNQDNILIGQDIETSGIEYANFTRIEPPKLPKREYARFRFDHFTQKWIVEKMDRSVIQSLEENRLQLKKERKGV